ncbi:MAG: rod shape-determining protein MreC [Phycisphaerales bacterium]
MPLQVGFNSSNRAWPAVLVGTALLAVAVPMRWQGWVTALGGLTQTLVAPVSGPVTHLVRWVAPAAPPRPTDEHYASLEQENQQLRTQVFAQTQENQRLREQLAQLRVVVPSGNANVDFLPTQVVGASSDLAGQAVVLRAGSRDGVQVGDVVTTDFVQVMGRVCSVTARTSTVLPITADRAEEMEAVVLSSPTTVRCRLAPIGGGLLRGDLEDKRDPQSGKPIEPSVGDEVRLNDPTRWPASAQMLVLGTVQGVEPSPKQPLRKVVVVRPTVPDLSKVAEAVLRVAPGSARQATAGGQDGGAP